jgi:hypothetical protein
MSSPALRIVRWEGKAEEEPLPIGSSRQCHQAYCAVTNIGYSPPPDRTVRGRVRGGVAAHPSRSSTRDAGVGARGGLTGCLSRCKREGLPRELSGPDGYVALLPDRLVGGWSPPAVGIGSSCLD